MFEPRISIITLGVADMARSIAFYRDGLDFPTDITGDTADWAIFQTVGTRFALYPKDLLAADIAADYPKTGIGFGGITLAHNVRNESEVAKVLAFADPDGYPWEVAFNPNNVFTDDGTIWGGSLGPISW
jgi:catechol 2,3-dioxygenase-like lactoylglutathione lyase family enzyme